MMAEAKRETRECEPFKANFEANAGFARRAAPLETHRSREGNSAMSVPSSGDVWIALRKMAITSSWAAVGRGRSRPIRKKVIGRAVSVPGKQIRKRRVLVRARSAFPLVHQQAREHGFGVFLDPLLEERHDLFAEIGGMTEAGEFKALERGARSGEQKLPRKLGLMNGHGDLLRMIQEE
jgi:hypothetical protein